MGTKRSGLAYLVKRQNQRKWLKFGLPPLLLGVLFFIILHSNVHTPVYDIEKFSAADETIRSPITIENEKETQHETLEATQAVEDQYTTSTEITEERISYVKEVFEAVESVEEGKQNQGEDGGGASGQERLQRLQTILSEEVTSGLEDETIRPLLNSASEARNIGEELLLTTLYSEFNNGIKTSSLMDAEQNVETKIKYSSLPSELKQSLVQLGQFALVENAFFDAEATSEARKLAVSNVEPVMIRAGEVIVSEGATITNEVYEELALTGLLNNERNILPLLGLALFIIMIVLLIYTELANLSNRLSVNNQQILLVVLISAFMVTVMKVASLFMEPDESLYYLVPLATGTMLLKILFNERIAVAMSIIHAILACFIFNGEIAGTLNAEAGVYFVFTQVAALLFLRNLKDRLAIVKAGCAVAAVNVLIISFFLLLSFEKYAWNDMIMHAGFGVVSAFLSAVLTLGLMPFIETAFRLISDSKLLTMSNPNHPLLKKILTEAPGTYHHSVMVANLSETACESVGANGLLARVASYYHDLGKTKRPHYFIENQMGQKNPHDYLEPEQSAEIIISHPYDGANDLIANKLPKEIVDIAQQHHGTTLLKYFYHQAKEHNEETRESEFRYPGPKPQTKEAAIVCICDSTEAAVRSLEEPTPEKIERIVSSIIQDRLLDGQFDECQLTFVELKIVQTAICETLQGIFHTRIQYPQEVQNIKEAK
ncbi:HD family phosphohydrolase [Thalassobacillus sp. CUG 92003]|uniref:HD family phosphohydrolase n=1 Tax=Thalassobacillus sp. CUG 92003 TaxID=2736641 RepID=UPI0015E6CCB4|nr:HD family phosphohydrolase [Thalassobacillus sp. CUG 92003]